jgi:hypothetical protein
MEGRRQHGVTVGRIGLLIVAVGTAWAAGTTAGGGHDLGAVLVAAPAPVATNPHPAAPSVTDATRPDAPARVSRDEVRASVRLAHRMSAPARRHVPR